MKKIALIPLVLLLVSVFNACEEEEEVDLILGKWTFVSGHWADYENGVLVDEGSISETDIVYLEFFKDGIGHVYFDEVDYDMFSWEREEYTLIVNPGTQDEQTITIETLTQSTLVFKMGYSVEEEGVVYLYEETYTMDKVD